MSSGISSQQLFFTVLRLPPAPLKTLPRFPAASSGLFSRTFPATRFFLRFRGPCSVQWYFQPAALFYGSETAACPPQNPPTLPCSVQWPFQPTFPATRFFLRFRGPCSVQWYFQPAALFYGSETAACPPQNPPTLPCSVQWPFQPTFPATRFFLRFRGPFQW